MVTSWNHAAERIFGYTAEEMIGQPITTVIPAELHEEEPRILQTIARGERIEHFETVRVKKSGERIDASVTISPLRDEAGKIIGAAKIARDITQYKKTEQALRVTERLASVGRLAATVAHEINNPLEAVTNLVYLAHRSTVPDEVRRYLASAEEELDRVAHLTKQTLGFYRETTQASALRLGAIVNPLISVFAGRTRNKAIQISTDIRENPEIHAVPGELRQLTANLLSNSIDAVGAGGRIHIRVSAATAWNGRHSPGVRLTITDSGPGIPAVVRSQLFEPFFTTKKDVGTGLGLWVCKNIVEKHHGSIRVKSSTTPGSSWTAFSVFLPFGHQNETEENREQREGPILRGGMGN
jgi:PAS domain S-box-containing protein